MYQQKVCLLNKGRTFFMVWRGWNYKTASQGRKPFSPTKKGLHTLFIVYEMTMHGLHGAVAVYEMIMQGLHGLFIVYEMTMQGLHSLFIVYEMTVQGLHSLFIVYEMIMQAPPKNAVSCPAAPRGDLRHAPFGAGQP